MNYKTFFYILNLSPFMMTSKRNNLNFNVHCPFKCIICVIIVKNSPVSQKGRVLSEFLSKLLFYASLSALHIVTSRRI